MAAISEKFSLKDEITKVLTPIFGESVRKIISEHYEEGNPKEMFILAKHMLEGYLGPERANEILYKITIKFPELKNLGVGANE